jgi:hypothetical protein
MLHNDLALDAVADFGAKTVKTPQKLMRDRMFN